MKEGKTSKTRTLVFRDSKYTCLELKSHERTYGTVPVFISLLFVSQIHRTGPSRRCHS